MNLRSVHPLVLAAAAIGVMLGLYSLHQKFPVLMPLLFGLSVVALGLRLSFLRKSRDAATAVDFEELKGQDIARYTPWLKENLRGHDLVVDEVTKSIQQNIGLAGPKRTLGAFLLAGPTGTGKTFFAELVSEALFPKTEPVTLRLNQYKHADDVFTLIGAPAGTPGYEVGGSLTRPILDDPYRVIILDEVDKCHPDVRDCLYNVLDTAHCREKSSGKDVFFHGCIFFATCNAGVEALRRVEQGQLSAASRTGRLRDALAQEAGFEKAFLARFDGVYLMDELAAISMAEVACLKLAAHWKRYGIEVTYASPELILQAMHRNNEFKEYGVRQMSRMIQDLTDASIQQARGGGAKKVRLAIASGSDRIVVERCG